MTPFLDSVRAFRPSGFRAMAIAGHADQRKVLAEVPGSELVVRPGPGHASTVDAPDEVTRELRRFLRSVEQPSA